mgnify:CR=1 FL=1
MEKALTAEQQEERERLVELLSEDIVSAYEALGIEGVGEYENIEEVYAGEYDSDEDFAQNMAEELGAVQNGGSWPNYCIDWEYAARDLMMDYSEENGFYFRNI